ncbi:hypothetical protein C7974DRAFT_419056 [Boeremia exigua]|uniref:uncharacterized protein n=1 Tax=Boeremia exigua TaxID=749465 RepID=UPI001E8D762E|nr:uncharacterized protein C7974DRAFT_419056 [Boeremia exigua]KAH6612161.1 hypothetical protein C7974DRAFT_419056 [Boeremia exigua]
MADPLSIVASIVGVGVASAQLANKVYDFTDKYKNAPAQMQDIASEMSHLSSIFSLLANVLKEGQGAYKPQVLKDVGSILGRVEKIQEEIRKLMKRNGGVRARVKWAMSFGKVSELLDRVEALKSSLSVLLDTALLALACREPRADEPEIERLKHVIVAGVKEIRQCVVRLQMAKPAIMFEPPKLLDAAPASDPIVSRLNNPLTALYPSNRHIEDAAVSTEAAMEPSDSQFETASWLYGMILAKSGGYAESFSHQGNPREEIRQPPSLGSNDTVFSDVRLQKQAAGESQSSKAPPPQRLYEISVSAVARSLLGTWTYLNPTLIFATRELTGDEQSAGWHHENSSDEDSDVPSPFYRTHRRTFTFEEYDRALEKGLLHDPSFQTQGSRQRRPNREHTSRQSRESEGRDRSRRFDNHIGNSDDEYTDDSEWVIEEPIRPPSRSNLRHRVVAPPPLLKSPTMPTAMPPSPPPLSPPPPPLSTKETLLMEKLEALLSGKAEEDARRDAEARASAELAKFDRLESLLVAQQEAQIAKEKAKLEATSLAEKAAINAKEKADDMSLAKLEELVRQQRDEQLKRDMAAEAAKRAALEAAEAEVRKAREESKAAAEAAKLRLDTAESSKEETEKKAQITYQAYEQALALAREASEETEQELREERIMRQRAEDTNMPPPLLQVLYHESDEDTKVPPRLRAAVAHLVDLMHGKAEKKWYATTTGPSLIDISDGYFARKVLDSDIKPSSKELCQAGTQPQPEPATLVQELTAPKRYHLVFPAGARQALSGRKDLIADLREENIEALFEMNPNTNKGVMVQLENALAGRGPPAKSPAKADYSRGRGDVFVRSSLLWQSLPKHGQSELYHSLCQIGWKPTYLRSSVSGQTWFYGERPLHVRFNRPDYVPRFAEFDMDDTHACVILCNDIVDEEALELTGVDYESCEIGYWMLDPTLTYDDIEALVAMSFALRETGLRRRARRAMNPATSNIRTLGRLGRAAVSPVPDFPALSAISECSTSSKTSLGAQASSEDYESADSS